MTKVSGTNKGGLSYPVSVMHVPQKGIVVKIAADKKELALLKLNHDLLDIEHFNAEFLITPWKKDGLKLRGHIDAKVVQACVATLEPIESVVSEDVDSVFVPENSRLARIRLDESGEMLIDPEGPDMPETYEGDHLDVGAIAEEFFELALDPYPRKNDADYVEIIEDMEDFDEEEEEVRPDSPFANLKKWQDKP